MASFVLRPIKTRVFRQTNRWLSLSPQLKCQTLLMLLANMKLHRAILLSSSCQNSKREEQDSYLNSSIQKLMGLSSLSGTILKPNFKILLKKEKKKELIACLSVYILYRSNNSEVWIIKLEGKKNRKKKIEFPELVERDTSYWLNQIIIGIFTEPKCWELLNLNVHTKKRD